MDLFSEIEFVRSSSLQELDEHLKKHDISLESAIELSRGTGKLLTTIGLYFVEQILDDFMDDDGIHLNEQLHGVEGVLVQVIGKDESIHSIENDDDGICVYTMTKELRTYGGKAYTIDFRGDAWMLISEGVWLS